MRALNDPSPGFESRVFLALDLFGTTRLYMRFVMPSLKKLANRFGVVSFIQTHVLVATSRLRPMDRHVIESGFEKLDVMSVGATNLYTHRNATGVS